MSCHHSDQDDDGDDDDGDDNDDDDGDGNDYDTCDTDVSLERYLGACQPHVYVRCHHSDHDDDGDDDILEPAIHPCEM